MEVWPFLPRCDHTIRLMWLCNWISEMPLVQCIARPALPNWKTHINPQEPWFLATTNLWSRNVAITHAQEEDLFETADGAPQSDPLSTLILVTTMSLLLKNILQSKAPEVTIVAYVDGTVLLGTAEKVTQAITEIQAETATGGLKLQKAKTQVWSPTQQSIDNGKTGSEEPEDAIPIGNEALVTDHINSIKHKLLDDLNKLEHPSQTCSEGGGSANCLGTPKTHHSQPTSACPKRACSRSHC